MKIAFPPQMPAQELVTECNAMSHDLFFDLPSRIQSVVPVTVKIQLDGMEAVNDLPLAIT